MLNYYDDYRDYLKDYRKKELHYTKKFVCRELGLSRNTLNGIENKTTKNPRMTILEKLADFYELTLAEVFSCGKCK